MSSEVGEQPFRILACVADAPRAELVARTAQTWASWLDAELTFLHVSDHGQQRDAWPLSKHSPDILQGRSLVTRSGRADRVICDEASRLSADLVILGALEQDGLMTSILGSVARRVARRADCSVLLLANPVTPSIRQVVSAVSLDDASSVMLDFVLRLARHIEVERLFVIHEYDSYGGMLRILGEQERKARQYQAEAERDECRQLREYLAGFDFQGLSYEARCLDGQIGQEVVEFVLEQEADLLTVPTPERLSFWDRFFHHPSETALHRLPSSLLLHRARRGRSR